MNAVSYKCFGFDSLYAKLICQLDQRINRAGTHLIYCADVLHKPICQNIQTFDLQARSCRLRFVGIVFELIDELVGAGPLLHKVGPEWSLGVHYYYL